MDIMPFIIYKINFLTLIPQATGYTPLMMAVKDNKTPLIDRLVDLGADPCARNNVSQRKFPPFFFLIHFLIFFYQLMKSC